MPWLLNSTSIRGKEIKNESQRPRPIRPDLGNRFTPLGAKGASKEGSKSQAATTRALTIAISREAGAEGAAIGAAIGSLLGWPVYNDELLERIAQDMGVQKSLLDSVDEKGMGLRGVLLWNDWEQVDSARKLIAEAGPFCAKDLKRRLAGLATNSGASVYNAP
jgi:hypothetical protein